MSPDGDPTVNDVLTEVRFWSQVLTDAKRTVLCSPENESRCKGYVDARGLGGIITVEANPYVPDDRLFVVDTNAVQASIDQGASRPIRLSAVVECRRGDRCQWILCPVHAP